MSLTNVLEQKTPIQCKPHRMLYWEGVLNIAKVLRDAAFGRQSTKYPKLDVRAVHEGGIFHPTVLPAIDVRFVRLDPSARQGTEALGFYPSPHWYLYYSIRVWDGIVNADYREEHLSKLLWALTSCLYWNRTLNGFCSDSQIEGVSQSVELFGNYIDPVEIAGGAVVLRVEHEWDLLTREAGDQVERVAVNPSGRGY